MHKHSKEFTINRISKVQRELRATRNMIDRSLKILSSAKA